MWLVLTTALLIAIAVWSRVLQRSWSAPGAFFALIWVIAAAPTAVLLPDAVVPGAMLLVASFVAAVQAGSQLALYGHEPDVAVVHAPAVHGPNEPPQAATLAGVTAFLGACGIAGCVGYVWDAGYQVWQLLDGSVWLEMAVHYSVARYHDDYVEPVAVHLLLAANYAGSFVGGVLLGTGRGFSKHLFGWLPVVAGSLVTVITTAKSAMLMTALFTLGGWLAFKAAALSERRRKRSLKQWVSLAVILGFIAVVGTGSLALRYGDGADTDLLTDRVGGYLYGHMAALSAWLTVEDWSHLEPTWGTLTFAGPFEFLNLTARTTEGLYNPIGLNDWAAESNVFTAFRGAITDFGLFGAWFAAMLLGAFAGRCYGRLRRGDGGTPTAMTGLIFFYSFAAWSPFVSILAYNVILLALVITALTIDVSWSEIRQCIAWSEGEAAPVLPRHLIGKEVES